MGDKAKPSMTSAPANVPAFLYPEGQGARELMRLLHVDTKQRRVWICGLRVHHGLVGLGAAAVGAVLMLHDRKDFPWHV